MGKENPLVHPEVGGQKTLSLEKGGVLEGRLYGEGGGKKDQKKEKGQEEISPCEDGGVAFFTALG